MSRIQFLKVALPTIALLFARPVFAVDPIEESAVGIGVTAGNMWFVPIKAATVVLGLTAGAASFVLTGGNTELTRQIWRETTDGPYLITPDLARKGIGERPELEQPSTASRKQ
jgi:hypothetical protein